MGDFVCVGFDVLTGDVAGYVVVRSLKFVEHGGIEVRRGFESSIVRGKF